MEISKYDGKLAFYMDRLLLKNIINFNTCALATKGYDMIDKFYLPLLCMDKYECEHYPKLNTDLLKYGVFDDKTIDNFYSDHTAVVVTISN